MEEGVFFGPKNATPSQVVIKVRTGAGKRSFFESLERDLLLRVGTESNPGPVTIGETLEWYRNSCQNGKLANLRCFISMKGGGVLSCTYLF